MALRLIGGHLGMVVHEMLTGLPPWYCEDRLRLMRSIIEEPLIVNTEAVGGETAAAFVKALLRRDPATRLGSATSPSAADVREHPYFEGIQWSRMELKQVASPCRIRLASPTDTSYFDSEFTSIPVNLDAVGNPGAVDRRTLHAAALELAKDFPRSGAAHARW